MGSNPSYFKGCDLCPVEKVSWNDVQEFLKKVNDENPDKHYRLPTEAEWEYAARGGPLSKGFKYSGGNDIHEVSWYVGNAEDKIHPVGQKQPNELGIYDISGNVEEWCQDWYSGKYYRECKDQGLVHNPKGPVSGKNIVVRGASWFSFCPDGGFNYKCLRYPSSERSHFIGFRCAHDYYT